MDNQPLTARPLRRQILMAYFLGAVASAGVMIPLLKSHREGEGVPAKLVETRFSIAVLAGPKQAAQTAPANTATVVEAVSPKPAAKASIAAVAERKTSLPKAVKAAPNSTPNKVQELAKPVEVLPPARVSMPGGRLAAEDAPVGETPDPFALRPSQVYIRLIVNEEGKVVRGGIVRNGRDPVRDTFILKALASRQYNVELLHLRLPAKDGKKLWQLDQVIDYGTNDFIP